MTLTKAGRAEILRASQRDEFFKEQLSNDASELLQLLGGIRVWIRYKELVQMIGRVLYDGMTTALNLQTLGEEFTGMVQVNRSGTNLPKKHFQVLMILVKNCGRLLFEGGLKRLEKNFKGQGKESELKGSALSKVLKMLNVLKLLLPILEKTHKAWFYLNGDYYDAAKRMFGIRYVLVRYWLKDRSSLPAFRILGYISVAYVLMHLVYTLAKLEPLDSAVEKDLSNQISCKTVKASAKCPLCLNIRQDSSVTPCGHLFCWSCIISWLQEQPKCPLCRQSVQPSRVVYLKNY